MQVTCPHCQARFAVKAKYAGQVGGCPKCGKKLRVPGETPSAESKPGNQHITAPPIAQRDASPLAARPTVAVRSLTEPPVVVQPPEDDGEYTISGEVHSAPAPGMAGGAAAELPWIYLPAGAPNPGAKRPPYDARLQAALLAGLKEPVGPPPVKAGHMLRGAVVAALLVLLPVLYALLILAMLAAGLASFSLVGAVVVRMHSRLTLFLMALPLGLLLAAVFMIKPLFTRRRDEYEYSRRFLNPVTEPLMWTFIEHVCDMVGAAHPHRVQVVSEANAAAVRRGWFRIQYELIIGLPLLGALTTEEMAGLIAHEVGHFRQGLGGTLLRLIERINGWFFTVVYDRDEWDATLEQWAEEGGFQALLSAAARGGAWVGRKLLWLLGMAGALVSRSFERQQEFDADRYWCRVSGAASLATGMRKVWYLSAADGFASDFALASFQQGALPDNFPRLKFAILQCLTKEQIEKAEQMRAQEKRSLLHTHPSDAERVATARREGQTGKYHVRHSAAWLLRDFEAMCQAVTSDVYAHFFEHHYNPRLLRPLEQFVRTKLPPDEPAQE